MITKEELDGLKENLANAQHDILLRDIEINKLRKKVQDLTENNTSLADRNWELQKRIIEQATWPKM